MEKKVLYLITKANWGGAQKYVFDLATAMNKEFDVAVAYGEYGRLADLLKENKIETIEIKSMRRDIGILNDWKSFKEIYQLLKSDHRPEIFHVNSSKAAALGALAGQIARIPRIIFTVHGWPFKEDRNVIAKLLIYVISWFTTLCSYSTIVVSKEDEKIGKRMWFVSHKIHYVPVGIEKIFFEPTEELLRFTQVIAAFEKPEMSTWPRIVTIGEITANKGQSFAIEAIAQLKREGVDVTYYLVGSGEDTQHLQKLADDLGVLDRVCFADFRSNASRFLKTFKIFLLPSVKEGMPYVLLEAATAGLPIITTTVVNPEFIQRTDNVYPIPPGNSNAIAATIKEVLQKRRVRETRPAEHIFPLSKMVEATAKLYR